jgi:hypothetical protein
MATIHDVRLIRRPIKADYISDKVLMRAKESLRWTPKIAQIPNLTVLISPAALIAAKRRLIQRPIITDNITVESLNNAKKMLYMRERPEPKPCTPNNIWQTLVKHKYLRYSDSESSSDSDWSLDEI